MVLLEFPQGGFKLGKSPEGGGKISEKICFYFKFYDPDVGH